MARAFTLHGRIHSLMALAKRRAVTIYPSRIPGIAHVFVMECICMILPASTASFAVIVGKSVMSSYDWSIMSVPNSLANNIIPLASIASPVGLLGLQIHTASVSSSASPCMSRPALRQASSYSENVGWMI